MGILQSFGTVTAALALSACTLTYQDAPAMSAYFAQLVPSANANQVKAVAVCRVEGDADEQAHWFATVNFSDGMLYHYGLNLAGESAPLEQPLVLSYFNTVEMREERPREGCFDYKEDYRFTVDKEIIGYVVATIAVNTPFDEKVKLRLQRTAQAVDAAVEAHKKFVPTQSTWGITP